MRLAIRGWKNGVLVFEEFVEIEEGHEDEIEVLGEKHALRLRDEAHMIEFEFLDEPNPDERFFRFGTDPRGMVDPIEIEIGREP